MDTHPCSFFGVIKPRAATADCSLLMNECMNLIGCNRFCDDIFIRFQYLNKVFSMMFQKCLTVHTQGSVQYITNKTKEYGQLELLLGILLAAIFLW